MNISSSRGRCNPVGAKLRLLRYPWLGWLFIIVSIWMGSRTHRGSFAGLLETYAIASGLMLVGLIEVYPFILDSMGKSYRLVEGVVNKPTSMSRSTTPGGALFIIKRYFVSVDGIRLRAIRKDYYLLASGRKYRICYARRSKLILEFNEVE
jgi:hypothetical protein